MKGKITSIFFLLVSFISACNQLESKKNRILSKEYADTLHATIVTGSFIESSPLIIDSLEISYFFNLYPKLQPYQNEVFSFYRNRLFAFAWHDSTGKVEAYQILFNRLMQIEENGFVDEVPYLETFKRYANKEKNDSVAYVDLMHTAQYFHFAHRVLGGLQEQDLQLLEWHIPKPKKNYNELLDQFISGEKEILEKSMYPQYHLLRKALINLRQLEEKGGWPKIVYKGKALKEGINDSTVITIKKRLSLSGEWLLADSSDLFNDELVESVKLFQERNGLATDGVIGLHTINAMNVPIADRIKQVIINMERCRWMPIFSEGDYLLVNIPAFSLEVRNNDSLVFICDAIVGKETNKTAIFKGMMKYVVFNPYWNVPDQILKKEIIPELSKNKDYLNENHMEWYEGRLRQLPGPDNALGTIKFLFPNPFDIYLHDTPTKGLFKEERRAFSHGCIRISAPYALAEYLLRNQKEWTSEKINEVLSKNKELYVKLEEDIPVYVLYLTAYVSIDGYLNFREDIYRKDDALARMLIKK